jgi:hypothetical protein
MCKLTNWRREVLPMRMESLKDDIIHQSFRYRPAFFPCFHESALQPTILYTNQYKPATWTDDGQSRWYNGFNRIDFLASVGIAVVRNYIAVVPANTFAQLQLSEILLQLSHNSYVIRCAAYSTLEWM